MAASINLVTTRDLLRYRKYDSPQIESLCSGFLSLLSSGSTEACSVRSAFIPSLLGRDCRLKDIPANVDQDLRQLFSTETPSIAIAQGNINLNHVAKAWSSPTSNIKQTVFIAVSLHSQLENARNEADRDHEANLGVMVLATLAYQLAHWIFVKIHGYDGSGAFSESASVLTQNSTASIDSFPTSTNYDHNSFKHDVGHRAVAALFGYDVSLVTYTIGESELVKRKIGWRRPGLLTPPLIYQLTGNTPSMIDVSAYGAITSRTVAPWKEQDNPLYSVASILGTNGTVAYHGTCLIQNQAT